MRTNDRKKLNDWYFFLWSIHRTIRILSTFIVPSFGLQFVSWLHQKSGAGKLLAVLLFCSGLVKCLRYLLTTWFHLQVWCQGRTTLESTFGNKEV